VPRKASRRRSTRCCATSPRPSWSTARPPRRMPSPGCASAAQGAARSSPWITRRASRRGNAAYAVSAKAPLPTPSAPPSPRPTSSAPSARPSNAPRAVRRHLRHPRRRHRPRPAAHRGKTEGAIPGVFSLKRQLSDLESLLGHEETRATGIAEELHVIEEQLRAADDDRMLAEERARARSRAARAAQPARARGGGARPLPARLHRGGRGTDAVQRREGTTPGAQERGIDELRRLEESERDCRRRSASTRRSSPRCA